MKFVIPAFLGLAVYVAQSNIVQAQQISEPIKIERKQDFDLTKGWNAIFLEVEPTVNAPETLFSGTPVDIAATYFPSIGNAEEFITDPSINLARSKSWGVWYSEDRPESFLKSLGAVHGQKAYLVHAKSNFRLSITGAVSPAAIQWRPDAYNLVGFGVAEQGAPTFAEFFNASDSHKDQPIYRLVNGAWKKVLQPAAESMRAGEAFWIHCKKASKFQGPLSVELPLESGLALGGGAVNMVLRNVADHPLTATVERVMVGNNDLPVSIVVTVFGDRTQPVKPVPVLKPSTAWTQDFPPLEAGTAIAVPFEARISEMTSGNQTTLLKVTSDLGTVNWVPVYGSRTDLNP